MRLGLEFEMYDHEVLQMQVPLVEIMKVLSVISFEVIGVRGYTELFLVVE